MPDMWRRLVDPDVLIYLDLSHEVYQQRRPKDDAGPGLPGDAARTAGPRAGARRFGGGYEWDDGRAVRAYVLAALA